MDAGHHLKALLQLQLATDASSAVNLPYVLDSLDPECFVPSPHLTKWTTRIHSLLHSKDPGARWAGLCLAHRSSLYSQLVMIEFAQSWLTVAMPMLLKNEPPPTLKASIRLIRTIFSSAMDVTEFQRQVSTPNVPKFTSAIISIAEQHSDIELKVLCLDTLTRLVALYPTTHRSSQAVLSALSLRFLNGSTPNPTNKSLLDSASRLFGISHLTGGKVGAANTWRKLFGETVAFSWTSFSALRTTFPRDGNSEIDVPIPSNEDPAVTVPLNLDRLRCSVTVLCDLLNTATYRTVQVPLGPLIRFIIALLSCTAEDKMEGFVNPVVRDMEISVVPIIWKYGCDLLSCVVKRAGHHLTPNLTRLISILTFRLEQKLPPSLRLSFLEAVNNLLSHLHPFDSPLIPTRLAKAVLPSLSIVLATSPDAGAAEDGAVSGKSKKGKKRARNYEGDEVFKVSREVACPTSDGGKAVLAALDVVHHLLCNPNLSPAIHSLISRVLLSILLALPQMSPGLLSPDLSLYNKVYQKVQTLSAELGSSTMSAMCKSLPLVIRATLSNDATGEPQRTFDLLLHPRVPPLVRSMPHVEAISLFRVEESQEESDARQALGLQNAQPDLQPKADDILMDDHSANAHSAVARIATPALVTSEVATTATAPTMPTTSNSTIQQVQDIAPQLPTKQTPAPAVPIPLSKPTSPDKTINPVPPPIPKYSVPAPMAIEEDEDEEMPAIDMASDSEED